MSRSTTALATAKTTNRAVDDVQGAQAQDAVESSLSSLMARCLSVLTRQTELALADTGLNIQQFGVLNAIYRGRANTPSGVAQACLANTAAMTYTLDQLERKKLLARAPNPADRRGILLKLTDKGRALVRKCNPRAVSAEQGVFATLNANDQARLQRMLQAILSSVEEN